MSNVAKAPEFLKEKQYHRVAPGEFWCPKVGGVSTFNGVHYRLISATLEGEFVWRLATEEECEAQLPVAEEAP